MSLSYADNGPYKSRHLCNNIFAWMDINSPKQIVWVFIIYIYIYIYIYMGVLQYNEFQIYPHRCLSGIENVLEKF